MHKHKLSRHVKTLNLRMSTTLQQRPDLHSDVSVSSDSLFNSLTTICEETRVTGSLQELHSDTRDESEETSGLNVQPAFSRRVRDSACWEFFS